MEPLARIGRLRIYALLLALMVETASAAPPVSTSDPNCFFTTVASRLLSSQMGMSLSRIPVYPTNEYTPAVNRLLQVTANIYDATTTNYYPSVFRPLFWKTNTLDSYGSPVTNVYIVGYQYLQEPLTVNGPPIFSQPTDAGDPSIPFGLSTNNIYGIPWILGAKKGLPNFNALEMVNAFYIQRELQFNRNTTASSGSSFPYGRTYTTNQMYIMSISNYLGVEFWNSYASNYDGQITVVAQDDLSVMMVMTNNGVEMLPFPFNQYQLPTVALGVTNITSWSGYLGEATGDPSFVVPLLTNTTWLTNSVFYYGTGPNNLGFAANSFIPTFLDPSNYYDVGTPPLPQFALLVTNRLQAYLLDTHLGPNNLFILDYVQLGGMDSSQNINDAIADPSSSGLWSTNFYNGGGTTPFGINDQFLVSFGAVSVPTMDLDGGFWNGAGGNGYTSVAAQEAFFSAFFSANNLAYDSSDGGGIIVSNYDLSIQAPYTPTRRVVQKFIYEANDPLVHYLASDLNDLPDDTNVARILDDPPLKYLGVLNDRYMPWGSAHTLNGQIFNNTVPDANTYNLAYKDPWVFSSDDWNFPTNQALSPAWLGQIHRGTPWQTIYLKSTNILDLGLGFGTGLATWALWTDDLDVTDAVAMAPVQDWHMASYLASLFNTNSYASLFSINSSPTAWESLLNGLTVISNDLPNRPLQFIPELGFTSYTISSNSVQAALIANTIQSARAAQPGQYFTNVGDIFAIPQLSTASPYLNLTTAAQIDNGLNDEAYEAIPQQLLPLLRVDSIGSVVPANGRPLIQFTGDDNHAYAVQVSSDLINWTTISTNCPVNGSFTITNTGTANTQFCRSVLLQ